MSLHNDPIAVLSLERQTRAVVDRLVAFEDFDLVEFDPAPEPELPALPRPLMANTSVPAAQVTFPEDVGFNLATSRPCTP